jgi:hypothetical protein
MFQVAGPPGGAPGGPPSPLVHTQVSRCSILVSPAAAVWDTHAAATISKQYRLFIFAPHIGDRTHRHFP